MQKSSSTKSRWWLMVVIVGTLLTLLPFWGGTIYCDIERMYVSGSLEAALARASEAARAIAKQFNIPIVVQQNGQIVKLAVN